MFTEEQLIFIVRQFKICGEVAAIRSFGNGHINTTYLVKTIPADCSDYVLQKINHHVFKNIPALMHNIQLVTAHIRQKLQALNINDWQRRVLTLLPTRGGALFYRDEQGQYWRMYIYIAQSVTFSVVQEPQMAFNGGQAFGRFLALLADLPVSKLTITIPAFHDIQRRLRDFEQSIKEDPLRRGGALAAEIDAVRRRADEMGTLHRLAAGGHLPQRVTHNDTKFNNILFDRQNRVLCIVDLDTVMPGLIHFDFGDAIRTCTNTAAEDEADLSKVRMDIDLFRAYCHGFLSQTGTMLSATEIKYLAFSAKFMTYIIGLRFLTDYLQGDRYYRIHYTEHNLVRARAQFQLLRSMETQYDAMRRIIDENIN